MKKYIIKSTSVYTISKGERKGQQACHISYIENILLKEPHVAVTISEPRAARLFTWKEALALAKLRPYYSITTIDAEIYPSNT